MNFFFAATTIHHQRRPYLADSRPHHIQVHTSSVGPVARGYGHDGGLLGAGVRTHHVLVIDASLSMRYRSGGEDSDGQASCFDRAKRLATRAGAKTWLASWSRAPPRAARW